MDKIIVGKKDLIRINQEIGESGELQNQSSLDYALSTAKHKKSWLYDLSQIVRSLLVDHAFRDGNKRTALALILTYFDYKDIDYDEQRLIFIVHKIAKKNVNNVNKIIRMIKNAIIY